MLRSLAAYRWELWLIIGIPAVSQVVFLLSAVLLSAVLNPILFNFQVYDHVQPLSHSIASLLLLSVSYHLGVRHLGRELLASLWGYFIALAAISVVVGIASLVSAIIDPEVNPLIRSLTINGLADPLQYLALLWFAQRLSRVSITHAFFLVVYTSLRLGYLPEGRVVVTAWSIWLGTGVIALSAALIRVWLLGNFDRREDRFRKVATIILALVLFLNEYARVVAGELLGYWEGPYATLLPILDITFGLAAFAYGTVFILVLLFVLLGVVYLLRVRQPVSTGASEWEGKVTKRDLLLGVILGITSGFLMLSFKWATNEVLIIVVTATVTAGIIWLLFRRRKLEEAGKE